MSKDASVLSFRKVDKGNGFPEQDEDKTHF
jgi:hypothetical protein